MHRSYVSIRVLGKRVSSEMQPEVDVARSLKKHVRKDKSVFYTLRDRKRGSWIFEVKKQAKKPITD